MNGFQRKVLQKSLMPHNVYHMTDYENEFAKDVLERMDNKKLSFYQNRIVNRMSSKLKPMPMKKTEQKPLDGTNFYEEE